MCAARGKEPPVASVAPIQSMTSAGSTGNLGIGMPPARPSTPSRLGAPSYWFALFMPAPPPPHTFRRGTSLFPSIPLLRYCTNIFLAPFLFLHAYLRNSVLPAVFFMRFYLSTRMKWRIPVTTRLYHSSLFLHTYSLCSTDGKHPEASCKALYDFDAENVGELSFKEGDTIHLLAQVCCVFSLPLVFSLPNSPKLEVKKGNKFPWQFLMVIFSIFIEYF